MTIFEDEFSKKELTTERSIYNILWGVPLISLSSDMTTINAMYVFQRFSTTGDVTVLTIFMFSTSAHSC